MNKRKLQHVRVKHRRWLRNGNGVKADLRWANLSMANLSMANLSGANLIGADLSGAGIIISHFVVWHVCANAETLRIGCEVHGEKIATSHDVHAEFVAYWQVLCAMRDALRKEVRNDA